jgi:cytochrome c oxidase subunit III
MSSAPTAGTSHYFVPAPSSHPVMASIGLLFVIVGASKWVNGYSWGAYSVAFGMVWWLATLYRWFSESVRESEGGLYGHKIDLSFRWSMSWFIFSEVMFFGAFFTALWWGRMHSLPALGGLENALLWPDFKAVWPSVAAGVTASPANIVEPLPTINTALLLTSGVTMTIAHHTLREGHRGKTIAFMWMTVALGFTFLCVQGYEYYHLYTDLNLKLNSGIFGSTFYMLTGFHGFHVFVGMLMLLFITLRLQKGHFTADKHFGFEGAAWYWHFVDVVWLGLYILVYWL